MSIIQLYFFQSFASLVDAMKADYDSTGTCKREIARDPFISVIAGFALQKNSPFTQTISKGYKQKC